MDDYERQFWSKVLVGDGCWTWLGCTDGRGRGRYSYKSKVETAARVAWRLYHQKEIPTNKDILHKCNNSICIRPKHTYPGTTSENTLDTVKHGTNYNHNKTHCPKGHEYNQENTYWKTRKGGLRRECKVCRNLLVKTWRIKKQLGL